MYDFAFLFTLFLSFSVVGWLLECISCSVWYHKFVYDRGFLFGPYCPVYGFGAIYMYYFLGRYIEEPIALFVMAVVGTSLIEYLTSVVMEKIFNARWWDYSNEPFNLEGRICLKNALLFGVAGLLFTYWVRPVYVDIVHSIPKDTLIIFTWIFFTLIILDTIISYILISKIKKKIANIRHDATSDIDKEVRELLDGRAKSLFRSFPTVKLNIPSGDKVIKVITETLNNFDTKKHKNKTKK